MSGVWNVLALIGLDLVLIIGLIAIPLGLSGNFILLGAAVVTALVTGFDAIGWVALIIMAVGVAMGEIIEALLGSLVAQKYGASRWGMIGAFVGGVIGAILGTMVLPIIGSILGSFWGAGLGALIFELLHRRQMAPGMRAGWGAIVGKFVATGIKISIGTAIVVYIIIRTH